MECGNREEGKEKGMECGNREEAQPFGYVSVAARFTTPKIFVVVYQWVLLLLLFVFRLCIFNTVIPCGFDISDLSSENLTGLVTTDGSLVVALVRIG